MSKGSMHIRISRVVDRAWKDHSLVAWSSAIAVWIVFLNISFWSSTHSIAPSPGDLEFSFSLVMIHVFTGIIATFFLLTIVWYPEFMLGATEARIQSSRAREVSGEEVGRRRSSGGSVPCVIKTLALLWTTREISRFRAIPKDVAARE